VSWLVDADVLSQPAKQHGNARVVAWLEVEEEHCYTSAAVVAQLAYWVRTRKGSRRPVQQWLHELLSALEGRVLSFNTATACVWADQKVLLEQARKRMPVEDSFIAATARRHGLTIVTGNDKHFRRPGIKVFNPFKELPSY
jgi:predicted nucleic acid-binding protein